MCIYIPIAGFADSSSTIYLPLLSAWRRQTTASVLARRLSDRRLQETMHALRAVKAALAQQHVQHEAGLLAYKEKGRYELEYMLFF